MTPPAVAFRPHHFLCSLGYAGKGYSPEFTANMTAIVQHRLRATGGEHTLIRVVAAADDICAACPKRREDRCVNQAEILDIDARHAAALGLKPGDLLTWGQALERIRTRIAPKDLETVCKGCQWLKLGLCQQAVAQLRTQSPKYKKTPPRFGTA
ncbi:MAG: hypothetical protein CSA68_09920 [Rhodobacterales bacterium]|nr:MAG: hypothetical protein CSA68_09920 [Rhodobacterales bacterium]